MPLAIKFRAQRKNSNEWVEGYYAEKKLMNKYFILQEEIQPYNRETVFIEIEVNPQTVEQIICTD